MIFFFLKGECLHTLSGTNRHMSAVTSIALTDKHIISSSDDGTVKLWNLITGEFIRNLHALESSRRGGVVWRIYLSNSMLVCAAGNRNASNVRLNNQEENSEKTQLIILDFDWPTTSTAAAVAQTSRELNF
jgi:F-box/WD-40 domain protein 7